MIRKSGNRFSLATNAKRLRGDAQKKSPYNAALLRFDREADFSGAGLVAGCSGGETSRAEESSKSPPFCGVTRLGNQNPRLLFHARWHPNISFSAGFSPSATTLLRPA